MKGLLTILTLMLLVGYTAPTPKNQSACEKANIPPLVTVDTPYD